MSTSASSSSEISLWAAPHAEGVCALVCVCVCVCSCAFVCKFVGFPDGTVVKNLPANVGDTRDVGLIPGSRSFPAGGNGNSLQYSYLENSMDRGAQQAVVHGVAKNQTQLSD